MRRNENNENKKELVERLVSLGYPLRERKRIPSRCRCATSVGTVGHVGPDESGQWISDHSETVVQ